MKRNLKQIIFGFVLIGLTQSCVKESFEGDNIGDTGKTFISTVEDPGDILYIDPFTDKRDIIPFTLFKNAHNTIELNKESTVTLKVNNSLIDEYNEEYETEVIVLDPSIYTISNSNYSKSGDNLSIKFQNNSLYEPFKINIDGSKLDLSKTYAFAFDIIEADGYQIPSGKNSILVLLGIKNKYDGVYLLTGMHNRPGYQFPYETEVELRSKDANTVYFYWPSAGSVGHPIATGPDNALSWYGAAIAPAITFNESDAIIDAFNNAGPGSTVISLYTTATGSGAMSNLYDPETKTIYVSWMYSNNPERAFFDTLKFVRDR